MSLFKNFTEEGKVWQINYIAHFIHSGTVDDADRHLQTPNAMFFMAAPLHHIKKSFLSYTTFISMALHVLCSSAMQCNICRTDLATEKRQYLPGYLFPPSIGVNTSPKYCMAYLILRHFLYQSLKFNKKFLSQGSLVFFGIFQSHLVVFLRG